MRPLRCALSLACLWLDSLLLALDRDPDAIPLDDWRNIRDGCRLHALRQRLDLSDPFSERAPSHLSLDRGAPALLDVSHALPTITPATPMLLEIHPLSVRRFDSGDVTHHIMLTVLAFEHRHAQIASVTPTA